MTSVFTYYQKKWNLFGKFDYGEDKTILFRDRNFTNFLSVYPFRTTEMVNGLLLIIFFWMLIPCKRRYKRNYESPIIVY